MNLMLNLLAMAPPAEGQSSIFSFGPIVIMVAIFYFMLIAPQRRRDKERRAMMENLKKGDRIVFSGGLLGTVTTVNEKTLMVKVAENVKLEITRASVGTVLEAGQDINDATLENGKSS